MREGTAGSLNSRAFIVVFLWLWTEALCVLGFHSPRDWSECRECGRKT